ncbi:Aste57867_1689 [Aphanomyces stellatus]|uniref:Aste57867_1689 protein n=1 Tax=Aphanomyces stellatus TaxID=120398 RepID=A0A485K5W8_9STRA|nr:hypothetical protein As57867_001687 [Aphanomyces stellatus]VFT78900.1 Aste57867_1689 [Aphanomyces stellatus]
MAEAKARLGSLFGGNGAGGGDTNDPLRYSAPKEPVKATATPSASTTGDAQQNIIYSTTVALFKYDSVKKSYASCSPSPVGCVILGNNAAYSLLLYNAAKEHLTLSPVTPTLNATLQPGQYVNFYDAAGDNYSARFNTEVDAQTFIRTLFLTKVHVGIWGGGASISPSALLKEELSCSAATSGAPPVRAIADGDTVGVAFSVWRVVGNAGSSPLDVVTKYAPFEKVSATDLRKFRVGDKSERISALEEGVMGMKKGGTRILLAPPGKTNKQDWYILQIELVKVKNESKEGNAARRASEPPKQPDVAAAPSSSSNDLVVYEKQKEELEQQRQKLLDLQKEVEQAKAAAHKEPPSNGGGTVPLMGQQPPLSAMYPSPYGAAYGMPPMQPPNVSMYPPWMAPPPMGKPLDALVMELHTKIDHLIRIAPASSTSSALLSMGDASQTLRGVERLVGENERLLQQIGNQTQQFNTYEHKCDELQKMVVKLTAEKAQWKDETALHASEAANLTAARDAAMNQLNRMHQEVQQLRYALYQKAQSPSDQDALNFEKESRARADAALKNEMAARAIAEQELNLVKKQVANLTSLHESEAQSQRMTQDRVVAQLQDQHRVDMDALRRQLADEKMQWQQAQPSSVDLERQIEELRVLGEQWKANAAAAAQEIQALQAEKALRLERISELEQMQAFHANAREQEVQQWQAQVTSLEQKLHDVQVNGGGGEVFGGGDGPCTKCADADAKLQQAALDVAQREDAVRQAALDMAQREDAARQALEQADQLKKEAQELLLSSPPTPAANGADNVSELFKEVVNDIFYRFQDIFEDEVALDGNQVLKEIKKVLKQSTKEVLAKVEAPPTE